MSKQKKFARSPLLYIHQPDISQPQAPMQSNYVTPKGKSVAEPKEQSSDTNTNTRSLKRNTFSEQVKQAKEQSIDDQSLSKEKENEQETHSNKKFNDMTVSEKIDYFLSKPRHISMKCEVKTEDRSYRGTIQGKEEDQLLVRVGRRTNPTKINTESITDIRLIGF